MASSILNQKTLGEQAVENWDDDMDFQGLDALHLRHASSTTIGSTQPHHRDSFSSRMSTRSDRESIGAGDEDWQVLLPTDDEKSTLDAISSAKSAGIPIPQNVPGSALLGGTIKKLGGRKLKKVLGDDWGDDLELPKLQDGGLKLKKADAADFPDSLRSFSSEFPTSPVPSNPNSKTSFMDHLALVTRARTGAAKLEKFKDDDDDFFGDVPTIKIAKNRSPQKLTSILPSNKPGKREPENIEEDLEFPTDGKPLRLSIRKDEPKTPASNMTDDSDLDWAEGSLGTRFGGTRRDLRSNPSSSITFSPSASSCLTAESDDGLEGLILPDSNFKFGEALKKRMENVPSEQLEAAFEGGAPKPPIQETAPPKEDFFAGLDIGDGEVFDSGKLTLNRNIKHKKAKQTSPTRRPATTLTFTNKIEPGASKIPRPQFHDRPRSTLESVSESGPAPQYKRAGSRVGFHSAHSSSSSAIPTPSTPSSSHPTAPSTPSRRGLNTKTSHEALRSQNTTTSSNYLKAKRSMPAMARTQPSPARQQTSQRPPSRSGQVLPSRPKTPIDRSGAESSMSTARKAPVPFLPAGTSQRQSHHVSLKTSTSRQFHRPTSSDSNENAPINRPLSRLSQPRRPSTPTNSRLAPEALVKEAASKRTLTKPMRRRAFGDGNELEVFDDLPTSASSESKFLKQPVARVSLVSNKAIHQAPRSMSSPSPPTPSKTLSPVKQDHLPRFARDTNASRLAREQRIGSVSATLHGASTLTTVRETNGPLSSISTNWRPPPPVSHKNLASPMVHSKRRPKAPPQKPRLIKPMGEVHSHPKEEKGMHWNPTLFCWEGNENALAPFDVPSASPKTTGLSTPKSPGNGATKAAPALIANVGASKGVQMSGGMVFDPHKMRWLKAGHTNFNARSESNPMSPKTDDDDEDPFAGIDDLEDKPKARSKSRNTVRDEALDPSGLLASISAEQDKSDDADPLKDDMEPLIGEEFDVGPEFIKRLRVEEERWRSKVQPWIEEQAEEREDEGWKWTIRDITARTKFMLEA
ncbi:uncharacterized protein KY384_000209 [Bacidia gigantensis]|uniref:uncharacterized protein n=1 Tax=Bacidia gigantensis TaxID=2732470 RepID=UPI001D045D67|nr:uncharacterized protein KY384_000209 [Bacidia gigantensis]KAG8526216.1 hypothetical protein KY384_000209 [Bacidia gigantensis]